MKKWMLIATLALAPAFSGCLFVDPEPKETCSETNTCKPTPKPNPKDKPVLEAEALSGHLGNYRDCPIDRVGAGIDGDAAIAGDCADAESCQALNCADGLVSITMTNSGEVDATGVSVELIELIDIDGNRIAELPLTTILAYRFQSSGGDQNVAIPAVDFDGLVSADERLQLDVSFLAADGVSILEDEDSDELRLAGEGGFIRITFRADNHEDVVVLSMELFTLPSVDT